MDGRQVATVGPGDSFVLLPSMIEIELPNGCRLRVHERVAASTFAQGGGGSWERSPQMLTSRSRSRIYLALRPVDMRKGFDGLTAQAAQALQEDPFGGRLFLFRSRRGDRLKAV